MSIFSSIKTAFSTMKQTATIGFDSVESAEQIITGKNDTGLGPLVAGPTSPLGPTGPVGVMGVLSQPGLIAGSFVSAPISVANLPSSAETCTFMFVSDTLTNINAKTLPYDCSTAQVVCPVYWDGKAWRRFFA